MRMYEKIQFIFLHFRCVSEGNEIYTKAVGNKTLCMLIAWVQCYLLLSIQEAFMRVS